MAKVEPADSLEVEPVNTLCLWKTTLAPALERNWVPDPGYFRLDTLHKPILEFVPSFNATWEVLGQGRLFGNFESYVGKPLEFEQWYGRLTQWIRNNYRKNAARFGGYIGPAAHEFLPERRLSSAQPAPA
jgi:hypothetical protein